jgi:hypothetical protein
MKTRSSSGVGSKVDLEFDIDTLRISDCEQEDDGYKSANNSSSGSSIVSALKRQNQSAAPDATREDPTEGDAVPKIRAQTDSTKLRDFLSNLGGG